MLTTYGVVTGSPLPRPGYKTQVREYAGYATGITRVTGYAGDVIPVVGGQWYKNWSRHRHSRRSPWNADGSKILIDQKTTPGSALPAADPERLVLDAATLTPLWSSRDNTPRGLKLKSSIEVQWRPGYPTHMVSVRKWAFGTLVEIEVWDTSTTAGTTVGAPQYVSVAASPSTPALNPTYGFGWAGRGTISDDGRWTVLSSRLGHPDSGSDLVRPQQDTSKHDYFCIVDLEGDHPPVHPQVGFRIDLSGCTQAFPSSSWGMIDYCNISPSGSYVEVRLSGDGIRSGYTPGDTYGFIFRVTKNEDFFPCYPMGLDPSSAALRMGPAAALGAGGADLGLVAWMKNADWNIDSAGVECLVGGARGFAPDGIRNVCSFPADTGQKYGDASMVSALTGHHTHVGPGSYHVGGGIRFAEVQHSSGRCSGRRGWHLFTTDRTNRAASEVMWMRLLTTNTPTSTRSIERLCKVRTDDTSGCNAGAVGGGGIGGGDNAAAQAVAKPDGSQVMFASNWQGIDANPPGPSVCDSKCYIVSNTITAPPPAGGGSQGPYIIQA